MSVTKKEKMVSFWSERARLYEQDSRANTNDVWLREVEIGYVDRIIKANNFRTILDFGCANGYSTRRLAEANPAVKFLGADINPDMISVAASMIEGLPNLEFKLTDVLKDEIKGKFDFIYAIRVFQNIESPEMQRNVFDRLYDLLESNGVLLYVESYADGYARLNEDRVRMDLNPLPIHEHLTLLTDEFDNHVSGKMELIARDYLSSSYYLITRLLYSYIAKINGDPIDYNHPIHQVASMVPQIGDYGPQKASLFRRSVPSSYEEAHE